MTEWILMAADLVLIAAITTVAVRAIRQLKGGPKDG